MRRPRPLPLGLALCALAAGCARFGRGPVVEELLLAPSPGGPPPAARGPETPPPEPGPERAGEPGAAVSPVLRREGGRRPPPRERAPAAPERRAAAGPVGDETAPPPAGRRDAPREGSRPDEAAFGRPDQDGGSPSPAGFGSRYLSPAEPRGPESGEGGRALPGRARPVPAVDPEEPRAPAHAGPPPVPELMAGLTDMLINDEMSVGSLRMQAASDEAFQSLFLDKVYLFPNDGEMERDIALLVSLRKAPWVRTAYIDLLGFQQPFSAPRRHGTPGR